MMSGSTPNGWALPTLYVVCRDLKRLATLVRASSLITRFLTDLDRVVGLIGRSTTRSTSGETSEAGGGVEVATKVLFVLLE